MWVRRCCIIAGVHLVGQSQKMVLFQGFLSLGSSTSEGFLELFLELDYPLPTTHLKQMPSKLGTPVATAFESSSEVKRF